MNYRHIYHAGNFADVIKHVVLMLVVEYMQAKDKPFFVLDTHGGIGLYDLHSEQARKTAEADDGVARLWAVPDLPPVLVRYLRLVRQCNRGADLRYYPGSPLIVQKMLRPEDVQVVNELHPDDVEALTRAMDPADNLRIENRDGYECIRALLPPPQRRGMVLVDPPFEVRDEFAQMGRGLRDGHKRWAGGTYVLWYPIKDPAHVAAFHDELAGTGIRDILVVDFYRQDAVDVNVLNGAGLVIVNPPWTLRAAMAEIAPVLVQHLTAGRGRMDVRVVVEE